MFTIRWDGDSVTILDQRLLPKNEVYNTYRHYHDVADSIRNMETRGAPAIGIAAAMGIALAAKHLNMNGHGEIQGRDEQDLRYLRRDASHGGEPLYLDHRMKKIIQQGTISPPSASSSRKRPWLYTTRISRQTRPWGKTGAGISATATS